MTDGWNVNNIASTVLKKRGIINGTIYKDCCTCASHEYPQSTFCGVRK